jgi:DNA excision repair protein ERCC-4
MKIVIEQDDREPFYDAISMVHNLDLNFERKRMKVGDYKFNDIIVERKTIDDFCSSILDKRIEHQVENMKIESEEKFIIIIGNIKDRKVNIHENCILGKICSLVYKHNIKVIQCENDEQFLYILKNLYEKKVNKIK